MRAVMINLSPSKIKVKRVRLEGYPTWYVAFRHVYGAKILSRGGPRGRPIK
jgi:hypothetical protein